MVIMQGFSFSRTPSVISGNGKVALLPAKAAVYGKNALLVTGGTFLQKSGMLDFLLRAFKDHGIEVCHCQVGGEPSPERVDQIAGEFSPRQIDVVIAIGGGSVIDAGKAVAAMIGKPGSVKDYLEGVGHLQHDGTRLPFIAVPTTAGTGSEATKNAVLSFCSPHAGFKKSLRHEGLVPDLAVIDPILTLPCPTGIAAACGMDAFTQLFEGFLSPLASPLTDALALDGLLLAASHIVESCSLSVPAQRICALVQEPALAEKEFGSFLKARAAMCHASFLSGIVLANAGLGIVHGFASVIGGAFPIPHGLICGILLAPATRKNLAIARTSENGHQIVARMNQLSGRIQEKPFPDMASDPEKLCEIIEDWACRLKIGKLSDAGISTDHLAGIAAKSQAKTNPVELSFEDRLEILCSAM